MLHRDLKPSNLLLSTDCDLKICDFGLARATPENNLMTEYVVTRWYRAPELLLGTSDYTAAIDIWSVGCIFMEMMNRETLFPGKDQVHQLRLLMEVVKSDPFFVLRTYIFSVTLNKVLDFVLQLIGTPSEEELGSYSENAKRYIQQLPKLPRQSFSEKFPNVPPLAIDLLEKMLTFDPRQRITGQFQSIYSHFCSFIWILIISFATL